MRKFGVIDILGNYFIPCEYDKLLFIGGGDVVMLQKEGLWGAKSLNDSFNVDVPCKYEELKPLNDDLTRFSALTPATKHEKKHIILINNANDVLVESTTKIVKDWKQYDYLDSHFQLIDENHYITSVDQKYGMVSEHGFVSIPFIYESIRQREDGNFNVCRNGWGVIGLDGKTIVPCKYEDVIPCGTKNHEIGFLVKDKDSLFSGFLLENGQELIPAIHQHLMYDEENNCFYNGFGGERYEYWWSEFSDIRGAKWGCIKQNGEQIIPQKYDVISHQDGFILAGRDGYWWSEGHPQSDYSRGEIYCGVYDLYDREGNLLLGGFSKFYYNSQHRCYVFLLGGYWDEDLVGEPDELDYYNGTAYYFYQIKFVRGFGRWLILDEKFNSILRDSNGCQINIGKGFVVSTKDVKTSRNCIYRYDYEFNLPTEILSRGVSRIDDDFIILSYGNENDAKKCALEFTTGKQTEYFREMTQACGKYLYVERENFQCCIIDIDGNVFVEDYEFFTRPVRDCFFGVKKTNEDSYQVDFFMISNLKNVIEDILKDKSRESVVWNLKNGHLRLFENHEENSEKCMTVLNIVEEAIFKEKFLLELKKYKILIEKSTKREESNEDYYFPLILSDNEQFDYDSDSHYDNLRIADPMDAYEGDYDALWNTD